MADSDLPGPHSSTLGRRSLCLDMKSEAMLDSQRTGLTICLGKHFLMCWAVVTTLRMSHEKSLSLLVSYLLS